MLFRIPLLPHKKGKFGLMCQLLMVVNSLVLYLLTTCIHFEKMQCKARNISNKEQMLHSEVGIGILLLAFLLGVQHINLTDIYKCDYWRRYFCDYLPATMTILLVSVNCERYLILLGNICSGADKSRRR